MNYSDKQKLITKFLQKWDSKFSKLPHLVKIFASFPSFQKKLEEISIIESHESEEFQMEGISLVAQLDNPIEKDFFKTYWEPVSKNEYEYFIDLSSRSLPVFKIEFYPYEPYRWNTKEIISDISDFIITFENKTIC